MNAKKNALPLVYGSDFSRVDAHEIQPEEYEEIPELTDEMFERAVLKVPGQPAMPINSATIISLLLPVEVVERWRATGPGWQGRMADLLSKN
jgi:uncharacterized protein (DUF4415 family)